MIVPAGAAELAYLVPRMREDDRREIFSVRATESDDDLIRDLLSAHITRHCLIAGGHPVAAAGIQWIRPGYGAAWAFGTERWPRHALTITRACRRAIRKAQAPGGLRRLEALSWAGHTSAHRWLRALGFRREAVLEQYGTAGETFYVFARFNERRPADPTAILATAQETAPCV